LFTGGDETIKGCATYSFNDVNLFDGCTDSLNSAQRPIAVLRWYHTVLTLAKGSTRVLGRRVDPQTPTPRLRVTTCCSCSTVPACLRSLA
jgi:hypothetical protein